MMVKNFEGTHHIAQLEQTSVALESDQLELSIAISSSLLKLDLY